jgi:beta-xylosidase
VKLLASKDGNAWTTLLENLDVSGLNYNKYDGFLALRIGLLSGGKGAAQFKLFRYKKIASRS